MMRLFPFHAPGPLSLLLFASACVSSRGAETIQVDVRSLLNARPVTIVSAGKLVAWTEGLDGDYSGIATMAAGKLMGDAVPKALPDDGRFPATDKHPEVVLHFRNEDATGKQVRRSMGADTFTAVVPPGRYTRLSIFCMSANGASSLSVQLQYSDGTETRALTVPDWYHQLPSGDANRFYLAYDLAKWDKANRKTEPDHHYLFGLELSPAQGRVLTAFKVTKTAAGALTFWGATGMRTDAPSGLRSGMAHRRAPGNSAVELAEGQSISQSVDASGRCMSSHASGVWRFKVHDAPGMRQ
jgi:hypothetical protein